MLDLCSRRIFNEVKGVSRVVYDISGKPPATIDGSEGRCASASAEALIDAARGFLGDEQTG